ncbi:hypothetical protein LINPERHAP1_LOCUS14066, partial [Linum perenne]
SPLVKGFFFPLFTFDRDPEDIVIYILIFYSQILKSLISNSVGEISFVTHACVGGVFKPFHSETNHTPLHCKKTTSILSLVLKAVLFSCIMSGGKLNPAGSGPIRFCKEDIVDADDN